MTDDIHIRRTGDDYAEALAKLLPTGPAWPRDPEADLMKYVRGIVQIFGLVDGRAADLLEIESDPRITLELLLDWERAWGLPDDCVAEPLTIGDRQIALVTKMTLLGGQSRQFFIDEAAHIGYTITISEFRPFMVGIDRVGDNRTLISTDEYSEYPYILGPPENRFHWMVHVGLVRLTWFRCGGGGGQCGVDPHLRIALATDLECLLNRDKPAHTDIIFDYSSLGTPDPMAGTP